MLHMIAHHVLLCGLCDWSIKSSIPIALDLNLKYQQFKMKPPEDQMCFVTTTNCEKEIIKQLNRFKV